MASTLLSGNFFSFVGILGVGFFFFKLCVAHATMCQRASAQLELTENMRRSHLFTRRAHAEGPQGKQEEVSGAQVHNHSLPR